MATPFPSVVNLIVDGQPVSAPVTNRPLSQLAQRTISLEQKIDEALIGSAIFAREASVTAETVPGMAVYFTNDGVYTPAKAIIAFDETGIALGVAETAFVQGVVQYKHNSTQADVVLVGRMSLTAAQLQAIQADGAVHTGQMFLSATVDGKIQPQQPPIGIPVCYVSGPDADNVYTMFVNPAPRDILENHIHYRVDLTPAPAGTPNSPSEGQTHSVTSPDTAQKGWLPASHAIFNSQAPVGSKFGYNIAADPVLNKLWPPIPANSTFVAQNGIGLAMSGDVPMVVVNEFGIWWMTDCYSKAPWPVGYSSSSSYSSTCPYPDPMRLELWFLRNVFKNSESMVTSLVAADATIAITDTLGRPRSTGNLKIKANLALSTSDTTPGYLAVKDVSGLTLKRGIVTEGVRSLSEAITVVGTTVVDADGADTGYKGGQVTLDFIDPSNTREGGLDLIQVSEVLVSEYEDTLFYEMPEGIASSIRGRVRLPSTGITSGTQLTFYFLVLSRTSGVLPTLSMQYRIISNPISLLTPAALPTSDTTMASLDFGSGTVAANAYLAITSDAISVNPGDLIFFTLSRTNSDGYNGGVGILDIMWKADLPLLMAADQTYVFNG